LLGVHVIQQQGFCAVLQSIVQLFGGADFDLDALAGFAAGEGAGEDLLDAAAKGDGCF